jgi:hypothetical protein
VTPVTIETGVGTAEREIRLRVVIERPREPRRRIVASGTRVAEATLVDVVIDVAVDARIVGVVESTRRMAVVAHERVVAAEQREAREIVVEPHALGPRRLRVAVARAAALAELSRVRVVLGVAIEAERRRHRNRHRLDVAAGALDFGMSRVQREVRVLGMVESDVRPARHAMTIAADRAVDTVVRVVLAMAGDARTLDPGVDAATLVTGLAGQPGMAARERETAPDEVIERRVPPVGRRMTVLTLPPVQSRVIVVRGVAVEARRRRVLVLLIDVTAHAGDVRVSPRQSIFGGCLVIEMGFGPGRLDVAVRAFAAEVALVPIVVLVAPGAGGLGGVIVRRVLCVAVHAHPLDVLTEQRKVREVVIEGLGVQTDDVVVAPFVIGVAPGALDSRDGRILAVVAAARGEVASHILVAIETEPALQLPRKGRMARRARRLGIGVRGRDEPRHDQTLESAHLCTRAARRVPTTIPVRARLESTRAG